MFSRKPSAALIVAIIALVVALGGVSAAATGLINGATIKPGTIGHRQLAKHSVAANNLSRNVVGSANLTRALRLQLNRRNNVTLPGGSGVPGSGGTNGANGAQGPQGAQGQKGDNGGAGNNGKDGANGANPATPVNNVPAATTGPNNSNGPDSGPTGDGGWYFTGTGSGGSAKIAGGELQLTGVGIDSKTPQGGIGIAKAYNALPLSTLTGVSFDYHIGTTSGNNTPLVHVTVTGLCGDSKFDTPTPPATTASCFANLVYSPALNGVTASPGASFSADGFLPSAKYYSTTEGTGGTPNLNAPGGQNNPQPLSFFTGKSANSGAVINQISLDNGGSSNAPTGNVEAGADNLLIGFTSNATRYDFGG